MPYMMPSNFGMQYPYNFPYMQYGQQTGGSNYGGFSNINNQNTEQVTPHFSSGSTDVPEFSTQISLGSAGDDTPHSFLPQTQKNTSKSSYSVWSVEQNKLLLTSYFHFSNDSELGSGQKGDTLWGKIAAYLNEHSTTGPHRSQQQCKSHYSDINKKIGKWVGVYRKALAERRSGWSDDNYIARAQDLFVEETKKNFALLEEWKLVRNEPKYMVGSGAYQSSGSKRKSSREGDISCSSVPSFVRPEGRDTTKKKAKGSSRRSKLVIEEEYSKIESERQELKEMKEQQMKMMQEVATAQKEAACAQKEAARAEKMKMWMDLNQRNQRNALDEYEYKLLNMLQIELFGL
ncbi:uncharacterized protein LOC109841707 [Asparagus officinalis]|uniref:uncharacterized protein LOC109841707 n=1 Tax=Asparagus officinalis TaxID=4686 RepID=UPI00098E0464|nr:uncharacterized protein LOC109841707 [Asparagus officinalis]